MDGYYFIRIINEEKARGILKNELPRLPVADKDIIISILERIKREDEEEFGIFVDEVLSV